MPAIWLHPSNYFIVDNDSLPSHYGQTANLDAHGGFDAAQLGVLRIESLLMILLEDH
jgi:hypothetical protein